MCAPHILEFRIEKDKNEHESREEHERSQYLKHSSKLGEKRHNEGDIGASSPHLTLQSAS
jgi:hypothetical protein